MKSFRIKNIKSFLDSGNVELAPITILVGRNSCGKSSLLRFPVVLAQSLSSGVSSDNPIVFNGKYVDYGFFGDVIHNHKGDIIEYECSYNVNINDDQDLRFRSLNDNRSKVASKVAPKVKTVKMRFEIMNEEKKLSVKSVSMYIGKMKFITFGNDSCEKYGEIYYVVNEKEGFTKEYHRIKIDDLVFVDGGFPFYSNDMSFFKEIYKEVNKGVTRVDTKELSNIKERIDYSDESRLSSMEKKIKQICRTFDRACNVMTHVYVPYRNEALNFNYIGPFREAPARIYRDSESSSANRGVGSKGENVSNILLRDYRRKSRLIKEISKWTKSALGYSISIEDMNNGFFSISLINKQGIHSDISDVGYGISQVLPIVTQALRNSNKKGDMMEEFACFPLYIEQPELHLHPSAQAELADLFVKCIEGKEERSNIVIETHSEHLIRRLQVLISDKNSKLTRDMVKIYYVDKKNNGNAYVVEMKLSEEGRFETEWPTGFFDQAHKATMDLLRNTSEVI